MMISKLEITNFRSIKHLILEPQRLCALIGSNSVGKTNILKAIDLVLGEGWATKAKVARELFYDIKELLSIDIYFNPPVEYFYIDKIRQERKNSVNSVKLNNGIKTRTFCQDDD